MRKKHSPSPWVVTPDYGKENVYHLWNKDGNYHEDTSAKVQVANARLMAAAPELLEVVRRLTHDLAKWPGEMNPEFFLSMKTARKLLGSLE